MMQSVVPDLCDKPEYSQEWICDVGLQASDITEPIANSALESMRNAVVEGLEATAREVATAWVRFDANLTTSADGSRPSEAVAFIQGSLWWYMGAAVVLSVIVGGGKMAWDHRAEPGRELVKSLMTMVIVSGAGLTAIGLSITAANEFSRWIIDLSTQGTGFGEGMVKVASLGGGLGVLLVILLGLIAILVSFVQVMLLIARAGMLVILAGILPLTASFTNLEMGRDWFRKCIGWLIAWILYKPAAAIIYATAFRLTGTEGDPLNAEDDSELMGVLIGTILMIMALFALPALMRFVTPAVASMGGGGGGGLGAMAMSALPMGAMAVGALKNASSGAASSNGGDSTSAPSGSQATGPAQAGPGSTGGSSSNGGPPPGTQTTSPPPIPGANANGGGDQTGGPSGAKEDAKDAGSGNDGAPAASPTGATGATGDSATTTSTAATGANPMGAAVEGAKRGTDAVKQTAKDAASNEEGPRGSQS